MSALSLDDLRKGAEAKYPDFEVEMEDGTVLGFKPLLRLAKPARKAVAEAMNLETRIENLPTGHDVDQVEFTVATLQDMFRLTERTKGDYTKLKKWIGDDAPMWLFVFETYSEVTNLGEAASSES